MSNDGKLSLRALRGFAALVVAALALPACAGSEDATQKQLADVRSELMKVRATATSLGQRLDTLELAAARRDPAATSPARTDRPALDVVRLGPEAAAPAAPEEDDPAASGRIVLRSTPKGTVVEEHVAAPASSEAAQRDYDRAVELYRGKSYDKALEALGAFLARYPDHTSADGATFFRGECYFAKGEHRRAAEQYEAVVSGYPYSSRAKDALSRLVDAYGKLGQPARADAARKKLAASGAPSDAESKPRDADKKAKHPATPSSPYEP